MIIKTNKNINLEITENYFKFMTSKPNTDIITEIKQEFTVETPKEEVLNTFILMLAEIIETKHDFKYYTEVNNMITEIYELNDNMENKITKETNSVLLRIQTIPEYEDVIRCMRYYFYDMVKNDAQCSSIFKDIRSYIIENNTITNDIVDTDYVNLLIKSLNYVISILDDELDEISPLCLIPLDLFPSYIHILRDIPDDMLDQFYDAYSYFRYILY